MSNKDFGNYAIEHNLKFYPGNCGTGADGKSRRTFVSVYEDKQDGTHPKKLGEIMIDPSTGEFVEDTIPDGLIDPVRDTIKSIFKRTKNAYSLDMLNMICAADDLRSGKSL